MFAWLGMTGTFAKILSGTWNGNRKGIGIWNDELHLGVVVFYCAATFPLYMEWRFSCVWNGSLWKVYNSKRYLFTYVHKVHDYFIRISTKKRFYRLQTIAISILWSSSSRWVFSTDTACFYLIGKVNIGTLLSIEWSSKVFYILG